MIPASVERWRSTVAQYPLGTLTVNEVLAIIWSESYGKPDAVNPSDPSYGLMQVTMPIAEAYGGQAEYTPIDLMDPDINLSIGIAFLRYLKQRYSSQFANWVIAYNAGEGNLRKGMVDQNYLDAFNAHLKELNASDSIS